MSVEVAERWLPVVGFEQSHEISTHGRVRSISRAIPTRWGTDTVRRGKVLPGWINSDGYNQFRLQHRLVTRHVGAHVLVLEAFVGPCPEGMEGCHNDGDPANNRVENLRWDTPSENTLDRVRHGTHNQARKTHCLKGHEFTKENTYRHAGRRCCRACRVARTREWRQRRVMAA